MSHDRQLLLSLFFGTLMLQAPIPPNEADRLKALADLQVLDTGHEKSLDDLTELAAHICGTPIALISLVDSSRQWFKSKVGLETLQSSRDVSFCAHTILAEDLFVVEDATNDARFSDNPFVTGEPGIRFYAGVPLKSVGGHHLGSLCVIDRVVRHLDKDQESPGDDAPKHEKGRR
jgi:GAF domain-containing protein